MTGEAALGDRLDALGRFVRAVSGHVDGAVALSVDPDALPAARALVDRAATRLRLGAIDTGEHTVVALAGVTGGGKSSLFNALARMELSPAGHLRPTTGEVHACVWRADGADPLLDWLGVAESMRFVRESVLDAQDEASLRGLVLLDLPDMDSIATGHRLEADRVIGIVDLVIWVLDPQKYADQSVHEEYLRHMGALRDVTVVVFNKVDRLTETDAARCRADLARLVEADGLPGVPVIATSAITGQGVDEVRALLEKTVAERRAALARLEGELDAAVETLAPLVTTNALDGDDGVSREAVRELADGFAVAGGVSGVAAEAGRDYLRRAALPGWPFRRGLRRGGGAGTPVRDVYEPGVPPAEPTAVRVAVRRLAGRASAGLSAPWPDEVSVAASADVDRLPEELGRALSAARPPAPRPVGWWLARAVWWLAVASALTGAAWLGWSRASRGVASSDLPEVGGVWLPLLMIGAGLLVAVVLVLLGPPLARARARRYRAGVERRLREATANVAREAVAPVRRVLRDYAEAQAAFSDASRGVTAG